jgi:hypothetical protein
MQPFELAGELGARERPERPAIRCHRAGHCRSPVAAPEAFDMADAVKHQQSPDTVCQRAPKFPQMWASNFPKTVDVSGPLADELRPLARQAFGVFDRRLRDGNCPARAVVASGKP